MLSPNIPRADFPNLITKSWRIEKDLPLPQPLMPPVPQGLRDVLKDYPEHIETLQDDLNKVTAKRSPGIDPLDRAIWMLESALGAFISEAREELKAAVPC